MMLEQRHRAHLLCLGLGTKSLLVLWFHLVSSSLPPVLFLWGPHGLCCVP